MTPFSFEEQDLGSLQAWKDFLIRSEAGKRRRLARSLVTTLAWMTISLRQCHDLASCIPVLLLYIRVITLELSLHWKPIRICFDGVVCYCLQKECRLDLLGKV